ncbi:MAG: taurine dioxygenase [Rhodobiaceae bacterium]|nr:MAG: taurine dioxygenase [Rhodobiaceae bacterium]
MSGMYETIEVTPHEAGFGAAVTGLDLSQALPEKTLEEVKLAWAEHGVVYFPDQPLTLDELEAYTLQFGVYGDDPFIKPMDDRPHILELRREPNETATNFGAGWHSDWSFQEAPPSATILHSEVTPPVGGDTLYADGARAYEDLTDEMKQRLEGLMAIHSAILPYGSNGLFAQETEKRTMKIISSTKAETTQLHPLVRTHPVTGKKALYVSPTYTIGIEGMDEADAQALLGELFAHMVDEKYVYRHKWRQDMLTMWDNRCCLHIAEGGYDGHLRVMHRTTVAGDVPV